MGKINEKCATTKKGFILYLKACQSTLLSEFVLPMQFDNKESLNSKLFLAI